jgi:hypothetical protein
MGSAHDGAGTWTYVSYDIWVLEYFFGSRFWGCVWLDDYTMMEMRVGLRSFGISAGWQGIGGLDWAHSLLVAIIAMKFNSLISTQCVRFENDPWCYMIWKCLACRLQISWAACSPMRPFCDPNSTLFYLEHKYFASRIYSSTIGWTRISVRHAGNSPTYLWRPLISRGTNIRTKPIIRN